MRFFKYHGLGNDYIVLDRSHINAQPTQAQIQRICDRNLGPGSDGIILVEEETPAGFIVRIFNPDGSEAENSGNGMRIAARYLFDVGRVTREPFTLLAKGERRIVAQIHDPQRAITVDVGRASFLSTDIPMAGEPREVIGETIEVLGERIAVNCVNVGNPHCVVVGRPDIKDGALRLGPYIEVHPSFPRRTNVQFVHVVDRSNIRIEIWERGAGYTLASGTSSSACACVCHRLGLVDSNVTVHMQGGSLDITISPGYEVSLTGPITRVQEGLIDREIFAWQSEQDSVENFSLDSLIPDECHTSDTQQILDRARIDRVSVTGISTDSRTVEPGDLFFAIQGARYDSRLLINEAFDKGASAVVYEGELILPPKGLVLPVRDIRRAVSFAAHRFFGEPSRVTTNIGVTGTSGKTSVAWILSHALHFLGTRTFLGGTLGYATLTDQASASEKVGGSSPASELRELGNTTIDPVRLHRLLSDAVRSGVQATVFEATSQGVVHRRMRDVAWNGVIFTNLSRDHLDLHGTMEAYEAAKRELFTTDLVASPKSKRFAIVNIDDAAGARLAATLRVAHPEIVVMTITMDSALESDFRIVELQATASGLAYTLRSAGEEIAIVTPFIGSHNAYNVGFAAMALRALGYASATITAAIAQVPVVPGRLEPVSNSRANVFVDYAHKPDALEKVLMFLRPVCQGRLISVFGCGGERDAGKRPIMGDLSARLADITVVTSDNPRSEDPNAIVAAILAGVAEPLRERLHIKMDRRQAIEYAIGIARPGDVVLIAGKGHEPYQEINGVKYPFSDTTVAQEALEKLKHL